MEEKNLKKIGTQKEINHKLGKIVTGTIDKKNCTSCYLKISTYIKPEYSIFESIDKIRRKIKANMQVIGNTYLDDYKTYLLNTEFNQTVCQDKPNKKQYIAIELTIFPRKKFVYDDDFIFALENMGDTLFTLISTIDELTISTK